MLRSLLIVIFVCINLSVQQAEPGRKRKANRELGTFNLTITDENHATARIPASVIRSAKENENIVIQLKVGNVLVDEALGTAGRTGAGTASWVIKNATKATVYDPITKSGNEPSSGLNPVIIIVFAVVLALVIIGLIVIILLFLRSESKRKQEKLKWEMEKSVLSGVAKPSDGTPTTDSRLDEEMLPIDENGEIIKASQKAQAREDLIVIMQGSAGKGRKLQKRDTDKPQSAEPFVDPRTTSSTQPEFGFGIPQRTPSPSGKSTNSQTPLLSAPKENVDAYPWPQMEPPADASVSSDGKKKKKKKKKKGKDPEDVMPSMADEGLSLDVLNSLTLNELALAPNDPSAGDLPAEILSMTGDDPDAAGEQTKKKKKKKKKAAAEEAE